MDPIEFGAYVRALEEVNASAAKVAASPSVGHLCELAAMVQRVSGKRVDMITMLAQGYASGVIAEAEHTAEYRRAG